MPRTRIALLCALALVGFAANSLLTRLALRPGLIDPASFVTVRLTTGAVALVALARLRRPPANISEGSWPSALLLFAYAAPFSYAYVRMGAGVGSLVLFGTVQATMIGWGLLRGERPRGGEWLGLGLALFGLGVLTAPGATRPDIASFSLMVAAGVAWGAYSLRGRASLDPLGATAGNFLRSVPITVLLVGAAHWIPGSRALHAERAGVALAVASGTVASGVGYTLWYAALPGLSALVAAVVQLTVPILAAAAAVVLLDERLSLRLIGAGTLVLGGVWIAVLTRRRVRQT